ncbi:branched-chain amino acid ABC transporter permease [Rhizocola hellebori]|uniref:Branched-chain amino acid ABC transporter permease n=1 Tax=Rhizocola hellebori TaxID=1392758 RepID=A0A8J3VJE1_9ACTN|nr:branched-chain amino acid ABC transporter permease [Rhizocola hellebori]GIH08590.1 branched-chain amino acid ABC transporter permease [Rhizocola hellebori]
MKNRPLLYTSYAGEMGLLNTRAKQLSVGLMILVALVLPFVLDDQWLSLLAICAATAIGAIGLGLVTGYAGQVSLGHAFFIGIGTFTAAVLSGDPNGRTLGFGITNMLIWLPAAGLVALVAGIIVAPLATRLRGLYLAIVTLGLVVIGEHIFAEWSDVTGGLGVGRPPATLDVAGYHVGVTDSVGTKDQKAYWLMLILLVVFALAARNLARSKVGRAFTAIRDRDIAAGVIGVNLPRYKTIAFAISSFYAGCAGALLYPLIGFIEPGSFNLGMSVLYVAMVLIGGAGTISGAIAGAFFITLLPTLTRQLMPLLPFISESSDRIPNLLQLQTILYGVLIIGFLIFEPRGLFGIWIRIRSYWKSWPFSY